MALVEEIFNIIAPHECLGCQKEGSLLCYDCSNALVSVLPRCYRCGRLSADFRTCAACRKLSPIHSLWPATTYRDLPKEIVHRLKFERARAGAKTMAEIMAERLQIEGEWVITYVPTANNRVRQRGYDQAALLARSLSRRLGVPFAVCLARTGLQRQVGSDRAARREQMRDAFRPLRPSLFQGKQVLVIDDVLTTGATCEAAARTLRRAGAKRVSAAVFAVA